MSFEWLYGQLAAQYNDAADRIWNGLSVDRVTSLRVNTLKTSLDAVKNSLLNAGLEPAGTAFYHDALTLPSGSEPLLRKLPEYENGCIYLQSLSSMIPPLLLDAQPGDDVLDMCAAPGGKTSEIVQLTGNRSMITACEPDRIRCERLRSNMKRLGCERVNVLNTDARKLDDFLKFDRILLDAPCSGSGTLCPDRTDGKSAFSIKLVNNSVKLQRELLLKACKLLKRGGRLVYSTCSLLQQENEEHIASVLRSGGLRLVAVDISAIPGIPALKNKVPGTLTVLPDQQFEGFFVAVFEKQG